MADWNASDTKGFHSRETPINESAPEKSRPISDWSVDRAREYAARVLDEDRQGLVFDADRRTELGHERAQRGPFAASTALCMNWLLADQAVRSVWIRQRGPRRSLRRSGGSHLLACRDLSRRAFVSSNVDA